MDYVKYIMLLYTHHNFNTDISVIFTDNLLQNELLTIYRQLSCSAISHWQINN